MNSTRLSKMKESKAMSVLEYTFYFSVLLMVAAMCVAAVIAVLESRDVGNQPRKK